MFKPAAELSDNIASPLGGWGVLRNPASAERRDAPPASERPAKGSGSHRRARAANCPAKLHRPLVTLCEGGVAYSALSAAPLLPTVTIVKITRLGELI